jgi:hypothetical protein
MSVDCVRPRLSEAACACLKGFAGAALPFRVAASAGVRCGWLAAWRNVACSLGFDGRGLERIPDAELTVVDDGAGRVVLLDLVEDGREGHGSVLRFGDGEGVFHPYKASHVSLEGHRRRLVLQGGVPQQERFAGALAEFVDFALDALGGREISERLIHGGAEGDDESEDAEGGHLPGLDVFFQVR